MPIGTNDIKIKYSVKTGSAGNSTAGTAAGSLGKYISTTEIADATLNALWDDVTGDENAASEAEYRCIFFHNSHATLTLQAAKVWLSAEDASGAAIALAIDDLAASAIGSASAQADEVADENTAPGTGVGTFSSPTTKATGLSVGDLDAGECRAVWVRRTAANTSAHNDDDVTIRIEGDTAA